jgi:cyclase
MTPISRSAMPGRSAPIWKGWASRKIRVVLSHWHKDHIAGNAIFSDCEIIALTLTAEKLQRTATRSKPPTRRFLRSIMPTTLFDGRLELPVGRRRVELHHFAIHSADGNVIWLPDERLLLAGDTLEDTVTYVSEAAEIGTHIAELLPGCAPGRSAKILPSHGDRARIAEGGYAPVLVDANLSYLERLSAAIAQGETVLPLLKDFAAADIASGAILYFPPYEEVHQSNIAAVTAALR